jgi:hypothetical protein
MCIFLLFMLKQNLKNYINQGNAINYYFLLCTRKIANRTFSTGCSLRQHATCPLAHIHTRTYVYQRPPYGPVQEAPRASSNENHSCNRLGEVILAHCYCDQAHLGTAERSNGCGDDIDPLLL